MPFQIGHKFSGGARGGLATAARRHENKLISRAISIMLNEPDPNDKLQRRRADRVALAAYKAALNGDVQAMRFLAERHEGMPRAEVDIRSLTANVDLDFSKMSVAEAASAYQAFIQHDEVTDATIVDATATAVDDKQIEQDRASLIKAALAKPAREPHVDENRRRRERRGMK
jgi:hypothetical protein